MLRARQAYGGTLRGGGDESCLSFGWDEMDQSPPLFSSARLCGTGKVPALGAGRNMILNVLINISLSF